MVDRGFSLVFLVILSGCTASLTAPVTMPIWLILGFFFLVKLTRKGSWKFFTYLSLVQLALIALVWFLNFAQDEASILLALAPALGFVAAFRSLSMMEEEKPLARRKLGYLLQIFSATTAFIPFLILALQDQPP